MPACPGTSPEPLSGAAELRRAASDGETVSAIRADPDQPLGYVPAPMTVLDRQSFGPSIPNVARVYNCLLGGKDNYEADRKAAADVVRARPQVAASVRANRAFLGRAVRYLAGDCRVRQFIDVGVGLPCADNTHEMAQRVDRACRVVYVDCDPVVLVHARALLTCTAPGSCDYVEADVRDGAAILAGAGRTLDLAGPVAVLLLSILPFIPDADDPGGIVGTLAGGLASGSYLALSHLTADFAPEQVTAAATVYNTQVSTPVTPRTHAQVMGLFGGLPLVAPGVVPVTQWRPPVFGLPHRMTADLYAGLARIDQGSSSPWSPAEVIAAPRGSAPARDGNERGTSG